jgi:hypothetical protein
VASATEWHCQWQSRCRAGPWHVALPVAVTVPGLVVAVPVPVWRVGPAAGPVAGSASDRLIRASTSIADRRVSLVLPVAHSV